MRLFGVFEILLSGVCYGFLGIFGKWAYAAGVTPGEFLALRFSLASLILFVLLALTKPRLLKIEPRSMLICLALGVLGYAVFASFFFLALQGISASLTVLLLYLYPSMVIVGAHFLLGEKMQKTGIIAIPLAVLGLLLLVFEDIQVRSLLYITFGVGAAIVYSLYILGAARALKQISPLASAAYIQLGAAVALSLLHLHSVGRVVEILNQSWLILAGVSIVSTVIAMALFLSGLQKIRAAEASLLSLAEPLTGILAAIYFLGERLSLLQIFGGSLVITALVLATKSARVDP